MPNARQREQPGNLRGTRLLALLTGHKISEGDESGSARRTVFTHRSVRIHVRCGDTRTAVPRLGVCADRRTALDEIAAEHVGDSPVVGVPPHRRRRGDEEVVATVVCDAGGEHRTLRLPATCAAPRRAHPRRRAPLTAVSVREVGVVVVHDRRDDRVLVLRPLATSVVLPSGDTTVARKPGRP